MKTPSLTTKRDRTTYIQDVLATLSDDDLKALESWRRLEDKDSKFLGGRGRTMEQHEEAARAYMALSPDAKRAHNSVRCLVVNELFEAIQDVGIPEDTGREVEAVWALLGPDHPAYIALPAYALVSAYREALDLIGD